MYQTILVPLDGSAFSERALPMATSLASATPARVILVRSASAAAFPGIDSTEVQCRAVAEAHLSNLSQNQPVDNCIIVMIH